MGMGIDMDMGMDMDLMDMVDVVEVVDVVDGGWPNRERSAKERFRYVTERICGRLLGRSEKEK